MLMNCRKAGAWWVLVIALFWAMPAQAGVYWDDEM